MAGEGIKPALIENAAFAVGMASGPLALADDISLSAVRAALPAPDAPQLHVEEVKQRLMCAQVLVAAACWEEGTMDPVDADLTSVRDCGFPTYTGGVMSYIDTMGLGAFIAQCDRLAGQDGSLFAPSAWLRTRAKDDDRVYPSAA